jgi:hypothetical protein
MPRRSKTLAREYKQKVVCVTPIDIDRTWVVECRGKRFTVKHLGKTHFGKQTKYRGVITEFSRRARARRLRRIAEIDWASAGESTFLTVTYPDEQANHTMDERKVHRYLLHRWLERKGQLAMLWRVEWMPRKTGKNVGKLMPHMHFIYLSKVYLVREKHEIRLKWMEIIHATRWTQVRVTDLTVADMVSVYAAKYCAKEANASYLDNVPKRNRTGRHAGEKRTNLIPFHPLEVTCKIGEAIVKFLRGRACETLWWYDPRFDEGFTILGDQALEAIADFKKMCLDGNWLNE